MASFADLIGAIERPVTEFGDVATPSTEAISSHTTQSAVAEALAGIITPVEPQKFVAIESDDDLIPTRQHARGSRIGNRRRGR